MDVPLKERRQRQILELAHTSQQVTVGELSRRFGVSEITIRRDLQDLADQGLLQRAHGGAITFPIAPPEPPVMQRCCEQVEEKKRIGKVVAQLVNDGETILLSSGTTTLEVTSNLLNKHITAITNSLPIMNAVADSPTVKLVGLGGIFRRTEMSLIGHITEQSLTEVRADKVIMGIRAIDLEHGLTNDYLDETLTDRAILRTGREVIIAADHTKIGRVSTAFVAPLTAIHTLVTDKGAPEEFLTALMDRGIRVITA